MKDTNIRTPLKRAEGLGSSHHGAHHWILLRVTSLVLVPLSIWFVYQLISLSHQDHATVVEFFKTPLNAVLMSLFIAFSFHHGAYGLREVVEDYVHNKFKKNLTLLIINSAAFVITLLTVMAIIKMHLN